MFIIMNKNNENFKNNGSSKKVKSPKKPLIPAALLTVALVLTMLLPIIACSGSGLYSEGTGELKVVCTNFPPFDFARTVGGDKATVTILQSTGADLHNYAPTSNAIMAISNADVLICVGGTSDDMWLESALNSAANPDLKIIKLTEVAELLPTPDVVSNADHDHEESEEEEEEHGHDHGEDCDHDHTHDEHVWLSLKNAVKAVDAIAKAFGEADSENAEHYIENAKNYTDKLTALDSQYAETVSNATTKTLIFADRFPFIYMTHDYGIEYHAAFSGCSTEVNASFDTTQRLIDAVRSEGVQYVMISDSSTDNPPAVASTVANSTGVGILSLDSCQSITESRITSGVTYLDIMTANLNVLKEALK